MKIDIVIIGINSEATLKLCIESVLDSHYSKGKLTIYYVDGGSKDQSISIAKAFPEVHVLILDSLQPPEKDVTKVGGQENPRSFNSWIRIRSWTQTG